MMNKEIEEQHAVHHQDKYDQCIGPCNLPVFLFVKEFGNYYSCIEIEKPNPQYRISQVMEKKSSFIARTFVLFVIIH